LYWLFFSLTKNFSHIAKASSILHLKLGDSHRPSYFLTSTSLEHISHLHLLTYLQFSVIKWAKQRPGQKTNLLQVLDFLYEKIQPTYYKWSIFDMDKFWHLVWANLTFCKFSLFLFFLIPLYIFLFYGVCVCVCVWIKFYRVCIKNNTGECQSSEEFGCLWAFWELMRESDELAGHGLSLLKKLLIYLSLQIFLWASLPITTGHTSQWKRKGFHAKHNQGGGQGESQVI
jgi:hypothetical protein